jgi:DNA replication protein DnaC
MPPSKRQNKSSKTTKSPKTDKKTSETPKGPKNPTTTPPLPSDAIDVLSLEQVLRELHLDHAASILDTALEKAITRQDGPSALLDALMREQLRVHLQDRARRALNRSAIFPLTTLDTFDFDYPDHIDRDLVRRAASLDFIQDKTNCVLVGPSGVGKTHIANAIGQLACLRGHRVRFTLAVDLVNELVAAQARNTLVRRLAAWSAYDLLLVDELGYLSFDARGADFLYQVFNKRYQRRSTIVTTNLPFKDWGSLFHNTAAASAIAERLVHNGLLIKISGRTHRLPKPTPPDKKATT